MNTLIQYFLYRFFDKLSGQVFPFTAVTSVVFYELPSNILIIARAFLGVKIAKCVGSEIEKFSFRAIHPTPLSYPTQVFF